MKNTSQIVLTFGSDKKLDYEFLANELASTFNDKYTTVKVVSVEPILGYSKR